MPQKIFRPPTLVEFSHKESKIQKTIADKQLDFICQKDSAFWSQERKKQLFSLFKTSVKTLPAYQEFLTRAGVDYKKITTFEQFSKTVPPVSKDNYLRTYSWKQLCAPGALTGQSLVLTSTSGSTGKPFYFPRNGILDTQSSLYHQMYLRNSGIDPDKSTLVIVCFGMGVWIGGLITYQAFKYIAERGHPMTIITPGVNKKEIYEAMKNVAPNYDQIILCGYPPFMKDVIDEGKANGVEWRDFNIKMSFAAESFSEKFRDYLLRKTGMKNPYRDTANVYGSADLGTMAMETPIAILIRRLALRNKKIYKKLFGDASRLPTLAQFIPSFVNFEAINRNIYVSGDNVLPLVRYQIGDNGGVLDFAEVEEVFSEAGVNLRAKAAAIGITDTIAELPFVYVYERTDLSTKLYGAIIYPEYVKAGLQHPTLEKYITGKFTMFTQYDKKQNEYLEINVELKPGIVESDWLNEKLLKFVVEFLLNRSAEYKYLTDMLGTRVSPKIVFWPYEHATHFQVGIKQKWVKKNDQEKRKNFKK